MVLISQGKPFVFPYTSDRVTCVSSPSSSAYPPQDGIFFIHFFLLRKREARSLHGKALEQNRFRGPDDWQPDVRLVNFHYRQCLMAHIRGFSAGFDEQDQ